MVELEIVAINTQVRELRTMSINVPWLEVLKACYPNAQVMMLTMVTIIIVMIIIMMVRRMK